MYVVLTAVLLIGWLVVGQLHPASEVVQDVDERVLDWFDARGPVAVDAGHVLDWLGSDWVWRVTRWATIAVLLVYRRFRHLIVYAGLLLSVTALSNFVIATARRPPPVGAVLGLERETFSHPSRPVVELGLSLIGVLYTLVPRGPVRNRGKVVAAGAMAALIAGRLLLASDYPSDIVAGLVLGMAVPVVVFRYLTPAEAFPIRYGRERSPSLPDDRVELIRHAVAHQLGLEVTAVTLLRPPGSSGSTPMRLQVRSPQPAADRHSLELFAKLYSIAHLRADRWYKLARAILYGRLEDEAPFADIRHMVEHEDYMLRVAADHGLPVPVTHGVVELIPGREYVLVMEHLDDAQQLGGGVLAPDVMLQGFEIVAGLWAAGMAHRDIKPANLVVSHGRLRLVDLSFAELQATPWRQAVDLGNMFLCLALFAPPQDVDDWARQVFSPDEIAEALAATRSVTIPSQLRALIGALKPDLLAECARIADAHPPIRIQRWTAARLALTGGVVAGIGLALVLLSYNLERAGLL